jgi:serine/threonine-protein kinase
VLNNGPLSLERVVRIMRQVCGALDEAHLQGIVHRDLKPDNIILTTRAGEQDFVKLLDFGIAARRESGDAQKEQKLTQQECSSESCRSRRTRPGSGQPST